MYGAINIAGAIVLVVFTALYLLVLIILAICKCMDCCQRKNAKTWFNYNTRLIVATTLVSLFLTIMIIIIILGHVLGGENLYNGITEASDAPAGAAAIAKDEVEPISNAYIGLVSSVAVPAIVALNSSLTVAINFKSVVVSLNSVNVSFNELPNLDNLANIINEVEGKTNNVSAIINNIQRELDVVDTLVNTDLVADIDELEADLLEVSKLIC